MKYSTYVQNLKICPFCNLNEKEIIKKNRCGKVLLAKAPYHKDHLLVVPNRHVLRMSDLKIREKRKLFELVFWAQEQLSKHHRNLSILYREGNKIKIGKSVDHFHVNLIPDEQIGSVSINAKDREIMVENKYILETKKAKEKFK